MLAPLTKIIPNKGNLNELKPNKMPSMKLSLSWTAIIYQLIQILTKN